MKIWKETENLTSPVSDPHAVLMQMIKQYTHQTTQYTELYLPVLVLKHY